jgi:hypothetical protein
MFTFCIVGFLFQKWDDAYGLLDSWSCGLRSRKKHLDHQGLRWLTSEAGPATLRRATRACGNRISLFICAPGNRLGEIVGCDMKVVSGDPDPKHVSTRYSERQNLTPRMAVTAPEANSKINGRSFINPALAACARNFHWHPATLVASAHSHEPGQWRSRRLRNKY